MMTTIVLTRRRMAAGDQLGHSTELAFIDDDDDYENNNDNDSMNDDSGAFAMTFAATSAFDDIINGSNLNGLWESLFWFEAFQAASRSLHCFGLFSFTDAVREEAYRAGLWISEQGQSG